MTEYKKSVVSGANLIPLFSLGELYVSDFLKPDEQPKGPPCELALAFDPNTTLVHLTGQPDASLMWGSMYYYYSSTNPIMREALKDLAYSLLKKSKVSDGIFVDIASNDFELLSHVPKTFTRVGIDPSDYSEFETKDRVDCYIRDFFNKYAYFKRFSRKADLISCAAVFYDLTKPVEFLNHIAEILAKDGICALQLSYTPLNLEQLEVGVICHEHFAYYTLLSLRDVLAETGLVIRDVELNNVNGGSIRLFLQRKDSENYMNFADNAVANLRIDSLISWEYERGYNFTAPYLDFFDNLLTLKDKTLKFLREQKDKGKKVWGAAASTKSATFLQFYGIDSSLIEKIAERQTKKVGLRTIGSNIPIVSEEEMRAAHPDYLLLFAWFFLPEVLKREKEYLDKGGTIIVPCPQLRAYTKDGSYLL